jgi:hypothetical protein
MKPTPSEYQISSRIGLMPGFQEEAVVLNASQATQHPRCDSATPMDCIAPASFAHARTISRGHYGV